MTQNKTSKPKKKKVRLNKKNILLAIISFIAISGLLVCLGGIILVSTMVSNAPVLSLDNFESPESSQIFDSEGELIAEVGYQIRTNVSYDDLPTSLVDAFISVEDSRYFEHNGFDVSRFVKAMFENVIATVKAGRLSFPQGGSTLTMQLIDNSFFMSEEGYGSNDIEQKVQEIFMAMELESLTSKEKILEYYLNKVNFGGSGNIRGVQEAAEFYFGKSVTSLTLSESALLAGIVNAPTRYNPLNNLDYATERRNTVLYLMTRHGYITEEEADLAASINIEDQLVDTVGANRGAGNGDPYQSYIDVVIEEVKELTGKDPSNVPMKIYTAMDKEAQQVAEQLQAGEIESVQFPDEAMEMALVSLDNDTGEIVAIGGGRNYADGGSLLLNHATDQYNQPGSSVKPILSYALAFEHLGWSTSHVVTDRPYVYAGTDKVVKNYNGIYNGEMTLFDAVGTSMNTPALITLDEVIDVLPSGRSSVVDHLQALGFSKVTDESFDIGYAIGGSTFQANAVELAAAQSVIMNEGSYITPHTVTKIIFDDGTTPYEASYSEQPVVSEETAYLVSELLYSNVYGPYGNYMQVLERGYPVYAKTGTTNWGEEAADFGIPVGNSKDKWMISSTTNYTTSVWVGYEKADSENYWTSSKSRLNLTGRISEAMLDVLNQDETPGAVQRPSSVKDITHILGTFPYTSPISDMDSQFVTTGKINEDFYSLISPEDVTVENLDSFDVEVVNEANGTIELDWSTYPDPSKTTLAEDTKDFGIEVNGQWISAIGQKLFDWTWIFGPIRYRADVLINGVTYENIDTGSDKIEIDVPFAPGSTITICGYYAYEYLGNSSNQVCAGDIKVSDNDVTITIPSVNATASIIEEWIKNSGFTDVTTQTIEDNTLANKNEIKVNGVAANGGSFTVKQSEVKLQKIEITYYVPVTTTTPSTESTTTTTTTTTTTDSASGTQDPTQPLQYPVGCENEFSCAICPDGYEKNELNNICDLVIE